MADTTNHPSERDQGSASGARPATSWDRRKKFILAALCIAQFMVVLDIAVVNVALPSIKTDLGFTEQSLQWVITAYAIFFGGFLLLGGRLADFLGRRRLFMGGLILFSFASLMSGFAWSASSLIVFRSLQGLGGAMLSPAALAILVTTYKEGRERNFALGIWGGVAGSGAAAGTLLGGLLTSALGWEWIFFVNVPIGVALVALSPVLLQRDPKATRGTFDAAGAVTVTAGLMVLVYGLTRATQIGWSAGQTIALLAGSVALLAAFVVIELRSRDPLLPLRVLRLPTPRAANLIGFLIGASIFSQFFLLSLYMQQVLGYSALRTGVAYVATTFLSVVFAVVAQALVNRVGTWIVLAAGQLLLTGALILYTQLPVDGTYFADLLPGFVIAGIGLGLSFVPVSIAALTGVRPVESGAASGLINTSQQIGGAVGLAAISTVVTTSTAAYQNARGGGAVTDAALTHGFQSGFVVLAGITFTAAVTTLLLRRPAAVREAPAEAVPERSAAARTAVPVAPPLPAGTAVAAATPLAALRPEPSCAIRVLGLTSGAGAQGRDERLLGLARTLAPDGMDIHEFDVAALEDPDRLTGGRLRAAAEAFRSALASAEALLVIAPQGNGTAASLHAVLERATSDDPAGALDGMPVALLGGDAAPEQVDGALAGLMDLLQARGAHLVASTDTAADAGTHAGTRGTSAATRTDGGLRRTYEEALVAISLRVCPGT